MTQMKRPVAIRQQLSLTQQDLADYLQVSRSTINMYELGKRSLPTVAMMKLAQLEITFKEISDDTRLVPAETASYAAKDNNAKHIAALQTKISQCRNTASALQAHLQSMQQQYNSIACMLFAIKERMQQLPVNMAGEKEKLVLEIQQYQFGQKIISVNREEQFLLQNEISLLLYTAALYESALDSLVRGSV